MIPEPHDRRRFLSLLAAAVGTALAGRPARGFPLPPGGHPEPRPGADGSNVLRADQVPPELVELYDRIRAIPQVVDGVRCYCGCAELDGFYSLLSCFETSRMPLHCAVCQGEGRLVTRLHAEGRTLDEIRSAIDRRFA